MNGKNKTIVKIHGEFLLYMKGGSFVYHQINYKRGIKMKLLKEVIKNNIKIMILYIVIGFAFNFLSLYSVTFFQKILDALQFGTMGLNIIIIYGAILIIIAILGFIENYPEQKLKEGLYFDFKIQALKKIKTIDYLKYQKMGTGRLTQRIEEGSQALRDALMDFWLKTIIYLIPTVIFSLIFVFNIQKKLIIIVLVSYVLVIMISNLILKKLYSLKENILYDQEYLNKHLIRGLMELVVFRINKKFETEITTAKEKEEKIVNTKIKIKMVHEIFFTVFQILVNILQVAILLFAIFKFDLSVGSVVSIFTLLTKAYQPIAIFNVEYVEYKLNKVAIKKYLELLDEKDDEHLKVGKQLKKVKGNICFQNVSFSYNKSKKIINDFSLQIKEGTSIALVGESGSGKSTIIKLIVGLIKPDSGKILIDDEDLSKVNLNSYYDFLSYISQEAPIFDGTLRENIIFDKKIKDEKILEVLDYVCLKDFYSKLENGLDTELGEKGITMSGGERQRVALARLFFDNSKIIILDEATSAMDNITEKNVMHNIINKISANKTLIIVAHRLDTIKNVDNIYVLEKGKIVEKGTFKELLKANKFFAKMYNINKRKKDSEKFVKFQKNS